LRKLGIIGGMSWVSTRMYYETINKLVQRRIAPMASAPLLIESLDFSQLYGLIDASDWNRAEEVLTASAKRLADAGAEALVIAANSMHRVYDGVATAVDVPILHIADCMGDRMAAAKVGSAALIGTRNVMTESFYRSRLVAKGIDLVPPDMAEVDETDRIIYDELMKGQASRSAERYFKTMITTMEQDDVSAVALACTELNLVIDTSANVLPIFDSTRIHCEAAVDWICAD
jgi:aspartate racemase